MIRKTDIIGQKTDIIGNLADGPLQENRNSRENRQTVRAGSRQVFLRTMQKIRAGSRQV